MCLFIDIIKYHFISNEYYCFYQIEGLRMKKWMNRCKYSALLDLWGKIVGLITSNSLLFGCNY